MRTPTTSRPAALAAAVTLLTACLSLASPIPAHAGGATVTAHPSSARVVAGAPVRVTGSAPSASTVELDRYVDHAWTEVSHGTANTTGAYALSFPTDWYLTHRLRVVALDETDQQIATSPTFTVQVVPNYAPAGSRSAFSQFPARQRWNPCRPVAWALNPSHGFAGQQALFQDAIDTISTATGIEFAYVGTTHAQVSQRRPANGRIHVLIGWRTPAQDRTLAGGVVGYSSTAYVGGTGKAEAYTSDVTLDQTFIHARNGLSPAQRLQVWKAIMVHELGHTMGLTHVNVRSQMMYPVIGATRLGAGDLTGLTRVGAANGCTATDLRAPASRGHARSGLVTRPVTPTSHVQRATTRFASLRALAPRPR